MEKTQRLGFSVGEVCDPGRDTRLQALHEYGSSGIKFNSDIPLGEIEFGEDDHKHLVSTKDKFNIAMAKLQEREFNFNIDSGTRFLNLTILR